MTSIGNYAFSGCSGLTAVHISDLGSWCNISFGSTGSITYGSTDSNPLSYADHLYLNGEEVKNLTIPNSVTSIGDYAFCGCSGLTSVTIPNSVTNIGNNAFCGCSGLTSVTIPNSLTSIGSYTFSSCSGLTSLIIPNSLTSIGQSAFSGCSGLTSLTIGSGLTSIGSYMFSSCSGLTSLTIPNSLSSIGEGAFHNCSGLTSVTIESKMATIEQYAFLDCANLTTLSIPNGVKCFKDNSFRNCNNLQKVIVSDIAAWCAIPFDYSSSNPLSYARHLYSDEDTEITDMVIPTSVNTIGDYTFYGCDGLATVTLPDNLTSLGRYAFGNDVKFYVNQGTLSQLACWNANRIPHQIGTEERLNMSGIHSLSTQTTSTITLRNIYGEYANEYCINDGAWLPLDEDTIRLTGLRPEMSNKFQLRVSKDTISYTSTTTVYTNQIKPSIQATRTASSISAIGRYQRGDANVISQTLTVNGTTIEGNTMLLTGLDPSRDYQAEYAIVVGYGNGETYTYKDTPTIKTHNLTLTTSAPKVISAGNVIVAAESNLNDEETNVGFEWRREDWPDNITSNTGGAYLYEGTMEGYIRNLYTGAFWKFRPYYLSNSGTYYYGDWMGVDPTNTSYFEPTVHTYARINIEGNTALVRGYALRGTDNVTVQGFMYWRQVSEAKERENGEHRAPAVPKDAVTVEASGQVMEAQLTGLDYETTYCYVAFVKTSEGETFYGEEQTFSTGADPTGIEDIAAEPNDAPERINRGVYTLQGQKVADDASSLKTLPRGIYLVNGKKLWVK